MNIKMILYILRCGSLLQFKKYIIHVLIILRVSSYKCIQVSFLSNIASEAELVRKYK